MRALRMRWRAWPWFVGAGAAYLVTLAGTWWPRPGAGTPNLVPFRPHLRDLRRGLHSPEARGALTDLGINAALLMPTALLLARGLGCARGDPGGPVLAAALGCAGSIVIEGGQFFIPGRVPDTTDVVLNSLGVCVSITLLARWDGLRDDPHP